MDVVYDTVSDMVNLRSRQ